MFKLIKKYPATAITGGLLIGGLLSLFFHTATPILAVVLTMLIAFA